MEPNQKSKEKLIKTCEEKITEVFDGALNYIEVLLDDNEYKKIRSKILRIGNNAIRFLAAEINDHYSVNYDSGMVDVVRIGGVNESNKN
jgi:hypothetical protein